MQSNYPLCLKLVGDEKTCSVCNGLMIRYGKTSTGKQRLWCKSCQKARVITYSYPAWLPDIDMWIRKYLMKGVGIRGIGELLGISTNTVLSSTFYEPVIEKIP